MTEQALLLKDYALGLQVDSQSSVIAARDSAQVSQSEFRLLSREQVGPEVCFGKSL